MMSKVFQIAYKIESAGVSPEFIADVGEEVALEIDPSVKISETAVDGETIAFFSDGSAISFSVALSS
ncbi:hypothetical protein [Pseudaminobacter salicylatoxidans]|uniref:hypothetical protein n=1 Tax=Pseudaminobacter salicylatoxidans TaxID=93369 RepID=UPI00030EEE6A|nr:hypothetical protein [Pseudaminobacter salicylatoxidans]